MPSASLMSLREQILALISGYLLQISEEDRWDDFVGKLEEEDLELMKGILKTLFKEAPEQPDFSSLDEYLAHFRQMKEERRAFIEKLAEASPTLKEHCEECSLATYIVGGEKLSEAELEKIFEKDEKLAEYLSQLSVVQLEAYKQAVEDDLVKMPEDEQKSLLKLLDLIQQERFAYEKEWMQKVAPAAMGVATAVYIDDQINTLEEIANSLSIEV